MPNLEIRAQAVGPFDSAGKRFSAWEAYGWEGLSDATFDVISDKLRRAEAEYRKAAGKKAGGDIKLILSVKVDGTSRPDVEIPGFNAKELQDVHKAWQKVRQEMIDFGDKKSGN